jgi:hypothetical protein
MPFRQIGDLRIFEFDIFPDTIIQGVFTRRGGVSPPPWDSLNVGGSIGDATQRVRENRIRSFKALGRPPESIYDVWQVHSARVVFADAPRPIDSPYQQADIILTDNPRVTLFMRFADCTPIYLYDRRKRVIGLVHSGWLGTVRTAARVAVASMQQRYGADPIDILAAIGPSIGPDHYEIGPEVVTQVQETFGVLADGLLVQHGRSVHFDLWKANRVLLEQAGVEQIEQPDLCTACHPEDWYSHRGEHGKTGRFGALLAMGG